MNESDYGQPNLENNTDIQKESPTLFNGDPLQFIGDIGEAGAHGSCNVALYLPNQYDIPRGLGRWYPSISGVEPRVPEAPREWVETPQFNSEEENYLVVKNYHDAESRITKFASSIERENLIKLNHIFDISDQNRPVRLKGYGLKEPDSKTDSESPYLIEEYIDPSFVTSEKYFSESKELTEKEILEFTSGVSEVIMKAHQAGIAHGDIGIGDSQKNIFWNPTTKSARLIDWTSNEIAMSIDRGAIVELLEVYCKKFVGDNNISKSVKEIIDRSANGEYDQNGESNSDGTVKLCQDLNQTLADVSKD